MHKPHFVAFALASWLAACGAAVAQDRAVQVDPSKDEVLLTIKAAVEPTEEQFARITALYGKLREDQRQVFRGIRQSMRDGGERAEGRRARGREMRQAAMEKMEPLHEKFLAECRALLSADQHAGWDDCAAGLDMSPPMGRGRPGRGGRPDPSAGPAEGDLAPAFELKDVRGETVSLASLRGKPVVLEFGSYTCPVFRRKVDRIDELRRAFGDDVQWVLVYTREAHATDGRVSPANTRAGINIAQHTSYEERLVSARLCTEKMKLNLRVLVDGIDNKVTDGYGGAPNRGYVIDAEGRVVSKQVWIDTDRTRAALEKLLD